MGSTPKSDGLANFLRRSASPAGVELRRGRGRGRGCRRVIISSLLQAPGRAAAVNAPGRIGGYRDMARIAQQTILSGLTTPLRSNKIDQSRQYDACNVR